MARGIPTKRTLIGHSLYGAIDGAKWKWHTAIKDPLLAEKHGEELGMKSPKSYPIFKDEDRQ